MWQFNTDLWRFNTYTRGWKQVDKAMANGAVPQGQKHVMTSVGLHLWLLGGEVHHFVCFKSTPSPPAWW
jgi:hypothetical protein